MNEHFDGHLFGVGQPCFGCSPDHPTGFRLTFQREGDEMVTRFTPGEQYQGPPGIMHGGLVATLADEVAAWALIGLLGKFGFTASFTARLGGAVRVGTPLEARSRIVRDKFRIVEVAVRIAQSGADTFAGTFKFVVLDKKGAERLLGGPLPEAWETYCR